MSKPKKRFDSNQLDFDFEQIVADIQEARSPKRGLKTLPEGALDIRPEAAAALHNALKKAALAGKSRDIVADEVTHLVGHKISKAMLDNYVSRAPGKQPYHLPYEIVNAICQACDDYELLRLLCRTSKFEAVEAETLAYAKLGRLGIEKARITQEEKDAKKLLGEVL